MLGFLVQFVCLFTLALWVGGGAAITFFVAPAVFALAGSRKLAGEIVGEVLRRFDSYALIAGPIACAAALIEIAGTRGGGQILGLKLALVAAMLGLALYSRFALSPEIQQLRTQLGDEVDKAPREDPRRLAFRRLHGFSVACLMGEIVLGAFAIGLSVMSRPAA